MTTATFSGVHIFSIFTEIQLIAEVLKLLLSNCCNKKAVTYSKWIFGDTFCQVSIKTYFGYSFKAGERGGLVVYASDSGSKGRGFEPKSGQTVLCP